PRGDDAAHARALGQFDVGRQILAAEGGEVDLGHRESGRFEHVTGRRPQSSSATLGVGSVYVRQHDASEYLGRSRVLQNLTGPPVELILHRLDVVVTDRLIEPSPLRKI